MKDKTVTQSAASSVETADYIAAHLKELTNLARSSKMDQLVYFMEMAQIEAGDLAKQIKLKS